MFKFTIILTVVCVIAAAILGLTYTITKPLIAAQTEKAEKEALEKVIPGADKFERKSYDGKDYYEGYKGAKILGYALYCTGKGYAGNISVIAGVDTKGNIIGLEILEHQETPGLGARCVEKKRGEKTAWFLEQFKGKQAENLDIKGIEAITGATITTEAVIKAVKDEYKKFTQRI